MKSYIKLHQSVLKSDSVDMVSMEDITPNGRNYIMYLRTTTKMINDTPIPHAPVQLVPYDTYSAYNKYICDQKSKFRSGNKTSASSRIHRTNYTL